ncbi:hypothetical protein [Rhizobium sp. 18065]|uniref:hypothetical protein n=1 Tax=Rhizobium sp. 18065 TaxID=2681411 RepID=UPI00135A7751|nr:hypothetical protein [Rhizobium sp. 18065]
MPDHINIQHPEYRESRLRDAIGLAQLEAKVRTLESHIAAANSDLESIFTRIERGDQCELHMKTGEVYVIRGKLKDE